MKSKIEGLKRARTEEETKKSKTTKIMEKKVSKEKWSRHFGRRSRKVLIDGKILDYRYPIKGAGVWLPYGFKTRKTCFEWSVLNSTQRDDPDGPSRHTPKNLGKGARASEMNYHRRMKRATRAQLDIGFETSINILPRSHVSVSPSNTSTPEPKH